MVITSPTAGQVLKYNGTNWVNDTDSTSSGCSAIYEQIGLESWTSTHNAPIFLTQAEDDPVGNGNQFTWLTAYHNDVTGIGVNAAATLTSVATGGHAAFTSDATLQGAIRTALGSNAGVNAITNAQFTIVPTDGETHTIDGTSYPVMGKLYVPTGLSASSVDVVVVFHGTVSSGTIQAASETAPTQFLDSSNLNVKIRRFFLPHILRIIFLNRINII